MRVAILHDAQGWAQHLHSEGLRKYAPKRFSVSTHLLSEEVPRDAQAVYTINFISCRRIEKKHVATCAASHAWMHAENSPRDMRTRGVNPMRNSSIAAMIAPRADAIVCRNRELAKFMSRFNRNSRYIPAGVDMSIFHPEGRRSSSRRMRVGWSGQVNAELAGRFKGYNEVWEPLKAKLGQRYEFAENIRTAAEALTWDEMANWYRSLDVFLTTASAEGTPNGPMCAAACGAVVISTDVGQISDWDSLRKLGLIVPSWGTEKEAGQTVNRMAFLLEQLEDSWLRGSIAGNLVASIEQDYSYRVLAPKTLEFVCGEG
jgi:glycosyltransferase involved in cell wall biosynthesis